jgi:hypothetical protein
MKPKHPGGRPPIAPPGSHGTASEYNRDCRCEPCRMAWSRYQKELRQGLREGRANLSVSTELIRGHLEYLSARGVGYRVVADAAGIDPRRLADIKRGRVRRVRRRTEERILRVSEDAFADKAVIDAGPTNQLVTSLLDEGYSIGKLAKELGYTNPTLQFRNREKVTGRTYMRVAKLHSKLTGKLVSGMLALAERCA